MHRLPKARTEGLISEAVEDELVIYDAVNQTAHCLSPDVASVMRLCNGGLSTAEIAEELTLDLGLVELAVAELRRCELLEDAPVSGAGYSRREATVRLAQVGAAALAAPLITSVVIPSAASAASVCTTNANGTRMPATASCSVTTGSNSFGTSSGPGHCCGQCYGDPNGNFYCPVTASCAKQGASAGGAASNCCSGAKSGAICS